MKENHVPVRCRWAQSDPLMQAHHDAEWGVAQHDSRMLWEMLMLEGFQAGLSWITVLRKREATSSNASRGKRCSGWAQHLGGMRRRGYPLTNAGALGAQAAGAGGAGHKTSRKHSVLNV
jgi:hypothetical protein